ncbi:MAG: hypothetical protein ACQEV7_16050 [Bacillota bacterium]
MSRNYVICINKKGGYIPVYSGNTKIGDIWPNELFSYLYYSLNDGHRVMFFREASKRWESGHIAPSDVSYTREAFAQEYASWENCGDVVAGYGFPVRSACRVFQGTSEVTRLNAGDRIFTDGLSKCGETYQYRLQIKGYRKNGTCHWITNGWCDTDMEWPTSAGYGTALRPCVYSLKW